MPVASFLTSVQDTSPYHRPAIIREFANFLTTLPDKHDQVVIGAMSKLKQLLSVWHHHIKVSLFELPSCLLLFVKVFACLLSWMPGPYASETDVSNTLR